VSYLEILRRVLEVLDEDGHVGGFASAANEKVRLGKGSIDCHAQRCLEIEELRIVEDGVNVVYDEVISASRQELTQSNSSLVYAPV
jgi:hypothetical protein